MSISSDILRQAGIDRTKTKDDYDLIRGTMFTILQQRAAMGIQLRTIKNIVRLPLALVRQVNQKDLGFVGAELRRSRLRFLNPTKDNHRQLYAAV